jgi:hypothetical protein
VAARFWRGRIRRFHDNYSNTKPNFL